MPWRQYIFITRALPMSLHLAINTWYAYTCSSKLHSVLEAIYLAAVDTTRSMGSPGSSRASTSIIHDHSWCNQYLFRPEAVIFGNANWNIYTLFSSASRKAAELFKYRIVRRRHPSLSTSHLKSWLIKTVDNFYLFLAWISPGRYQCSVKYMDLV